MVVLVVEAVVEAVVLLGGEGGVMAAAELVVGSGVLSMMGTVEADSAGREGWDVVRGSRTGGGELELELELGLELEEA